MLVRDGYQVDFVGSQSHGMRPEDAEDWYDWNSEAYPGWTIPAIASKVSTALREYRPDILLVHVGTNGRDWENKPGQVKDMLDMINAYSVEDHHPVTVFLCLIINRFKSEDPAPTARFNQDVAAMVHARTGDTIKVVLVDMEQGATLDYSDDLPDPDASPPYKGGDMLGARYPGVALDKFHPNDKGNAKMALKFYKELVRELGARSGCPLSKELVLVHPRHEHHTKPRVPRPRPAGTHLRGGPAPLAGAREAAGLHERSRDRTSRRHAVPVGGRHGMGHVPAAHP